MLLVGGCTVHNPDFIETTTGGATEGTDSAPPATDPMPTTEPPDTSSPGSTSTMSSTTPQPATDSGTTLEPTTGPETTTMPMPMPMPACGDGKVDGDEQCDDGNMADDDGCLSYCAPATCGDGFVRDKVEQCDDGNELKKDECLPTCKFNVCGDGFMKPGEECDDGDLEDDDGCNKDCTMTRKIIFVTSKHYPGAMGGLLGADTECNTLAGPPANLPGTYKAWLSTGLDSPDTRMKHHEYPYVRPDGVMIAESWSGLVSGMLFGPIDLTEMKGKPLEGDPNNPCGPTMVHTNTITMGKPFGKDSHCAGWMIEQGGAAAGRFGAVDKEWTEACYNFDLCKFHAPIYCVQQ